MRNLQTGTKGPVDLYMNDLESAVETIKYFSDNGSDHSGDPSTADTGSQTPPPEYSLLYEIFKLYARNKSLGFHSK